MISEIDNYKKQVNQVQQLHPANQLQKQDGILSNCNLWDIAGNDMVFTIKAHFHLASFLIGIPVKCTLEYDSYNRKCYLALYNLKNNRLIDRKEWHLPKFLIGKKYSFIVLWIDEAIEYNPYYSVPVLLNTTGAN